MKVKCFKLLDHQGNEKLSSNSLTLGKEYVVLEIDQAFNKAPFYRLVGDHDDHSPALFDARQFQITSGLIPDSWTIHQVSNTFISQGPKLWQEPGFWEDCYDGKPEALEIYKREAEAIYAEEGVDSN